MTANADASSELYSNIPCGEFWHTPTAQIVKTAEILALTTARLTARGEPTMSIKIICALPASHTSDTSMKVDINNSFGPNGRFVTLYKLPDQAYTRQPHRFPCHVNHPSVTEGMFDTSSQLMRRFRKFMKWIRRHAWYQSNHHWAKKGAYIVAYATTIIFLAPIIWAIFTGILSLGAGIISILAMTSYHMALSIPMVSAIAYAIWKWFTQEKTIPEKWWTIPID